MPVLVVPGVSVEANFDVLPPLPAAAGIVGVVGVVDRPPNPNRLIGVTRVSELQDLCGPGTVASMPEAVAALSTGAQEVIVSAVAGGAASSVTLVNAADAPAVRLRARSRGAWANRLSADVRTVTNAAGEVVRVTLRILQNNVEAERFDDLIVEPGQPLDLFAVVNAQSNHVVAVEPGFEGDDPKPGVYPLDADGTAEVEQAGAAGTVLMDVRLVPGAAGDGVTVRIDGSDDEIALEVTRNGAREELFEGLTMDPDSERHLPAVLSGQSRFIRARAAQLARGRCPATARDTRAGRIRRGLLAERRGLPDGDRPADRGPAHRPRDGEFRPGARLRQRHPDPPGAARAHARRERRGRPAHRLRIDPRRGRRRPRRHPRPRRGGAEPPLRARRAAWRDRSGRRAHRPDQPRDLADLQVGAASRASRRPTTARASSTACSGRARTCSSSSSARVAA